MPAAICIRWASSCSRPSRGGRRFPRRAPRRCSTCTNIIRRPRSAACGATRPRRSLPRSPKPWPRAPAIAGRRRRRCRKRCGRSHTPPDGSMKARCLLGLLALAACQPQSQRLLLLDLQLSDPIALDATAEPWHAAGYTVEYRRFYPHLTRNDLRRYRGVVLLGGAEPERSSDALSAGDLALLGEWVGRGGVVVFGYAGDGEGFLDRWVMNRWLASQGSGIVIGDYALRDTTLRPDADGLARTRDFLVALARWTRRPAEWAHVPPARAGRRIVLLDSPRPVSPRPPRLAPPARVVLESLPAPGDAGRRATPPRPLPWAPRQPLRALWAPLPLRPGTFAAPRRASLDSLLAFLDVGGFNTLIGDAAAWAADSLHAAPWERDAIRAAWRQTVDQLETTSFDWIPAITLREFRVPVDTPARGVRGDTLAAWCALDSRLWDQALAPATRQLARLAAGAPDLIPAVAIDLDAAGVGTDSYAFCDPAWRAGLAGLPGDTALGTERRERLRTLPVEQRYDTLLDAGLLDAYYGALERAVGRRAAELRGQARRLDPELAFALRTTRFPSDWWGLGLTTGLAEPGSAVVLLTAASAVRLPLARLSAHGAPAVHALELVPERLPAAAWSRLGRIVFAAHSGFWIPAAGGTPGRSRTAEGPLSPDSLARLIRRLGK